METNHNPWVGLRAYKEGEILYGRDKDILELTTYVLAEKEVVLYGRSGTGKSSIINAGVLPSARRNGFIPLTIRLEHGSSAPDYLKQIKNAIVKVGVTIKNVTPYKKDDSPLLWEFFHCNEFLDREGRQVKFLIIFDQFEEIFTLQEDETSRERFFQELADFLNDIMPEEVCVDENETMHFAATKDSGAEPEIDIFSQIENLDIEECRNVSSFVNNDVHVVFTLREDYLSEFEYYTRKIPTLKQHRYAFRPIDERQAMEIIVKPRKGLVTEDVARQIIAKINKSSDGEINSSTGIDTMILSLFLSELYQRLPEGSTSITSDMLDKFGNKIIKDFYISTVSDRSKIREESVKWIERILLTKDNHRDNKDIKEVTDKKYGLTHEELQYLEKDKRILSRFTRSKITRIEFVHDVIADVAAQHKLQLEAELSAQKERDEHERKAKRKVWATIIVSVAVLAIALWGMWSYMSRPKQGLPMKQTFMISFLEDSLTTENDYWKGMLLVVGHRADSPDTLLKQCEVNKGLRDSIFKIEIDTLHSVTFSMTFPGYKYRDTIFEKKYSELIATLNIPIQIKKKLPKTYPYFGNISAEVNGELWPVQNALICLHDITTRTDSLGNFKYHLEKDISEDDDIIIIRKDFSADYPKAKDNLYENIHRFVITPKDSTIIDRVLNIKFQVDSIFRNNPNYSYGKGMTNKKIINADGSTDYITLRARYIRQIEKSNKYEIEGYFFFGSDIKNKNEEEIPYSYYVFNGELDKSGPDGVRNYSIEGKNFVGNPLNITGTYRANEKWDGEISSPFGYRATFTVK